MTCRTVIVLTMLNLIPVWSAAEDASLAEQLAKLDTNVGQRDDQRRWAAQLRELQGRRLREANAASSAAWSQISDRMAWEQFVNAKRDALSRSLGTWPAAPTDVPMEVAIRIVDIVAGDGFEIDQLAFESRPGWWVTANRYRPAKPRESSPGLLICHAHHTPKEHAELQDMGMTWARQGCVVLIPDQLGHGERRQHPFATSEDGEKAVAAWDQLVWKHRDQISPPPRNPDELPKASFRLTRQDYYFRYDSSLQLYLVGESLMGWMAWDLMRGVDVLLATPSVDAGRIAILGSVAGGGDPAAVTAALDPRIAAAVPFNFGGPQPETRFPLPEDAETSFNYAGSGSWESTRNLARSAADGFLPWVIVGGIAPRRLIFGHEFTWDQPRDPVWKRLERIFSWYNARDRLAFTHGFGELRQSPPDASHCTHIGRVHRVKIHDAFEKWFGIQVGKDDEYSRPVSKNDLTVLTADLRREIKPQSLGEAAGRLADQRLAEARRRRAAKTDSPPAASLTAGFEKLLGRTEPLGEAKVVDRMVERRVGQFRAERLVLEVEPGIQLPLVILSPDEKTPPKAVVIAVAQSGKKGFVTRRTEELATLVNGGAAVVLPDLRGTGEGREDDDRGRTSSDTSRSATELMLGGTILGARVRDLRAVMRYVRGRAELAAAPVALWGDSLAPTNPPGVVPIVPHDAERKPRASEPGGALVVMLAALAEPTVRAVYARGCVSGFQGVVERAQVLIPHDVVVPGWLTVGDVADLAAALAPRPLNLAATVNAQNQIASDESLEREFAPVNAAYRAASAGDAWSRHERAVAPWLLENVAR